MTMCSQRSGCAPLLDRLGKQLGAIHHAESFCKRGQRVAQVDALRGMGIDEVILEGLVGVPERRRVAVDRVLRLQCFPGL